MLADFATKITLASNLTGSSAPDAEPAGIENEALAAGFNNVPFDEIEIG